MTVLNLEISIAQVGDDGIDFGVEDTYVYEGDETEYGER